MEGGYRIVFVDLDNGFESSPHQLPDILKTPNGPGDGNMFRDSHIHIISGLKTRLILIMSTRKKFEGVHPNKWVFTKKQRNNFMEFE